MTACHAATSELLIS